MRTPSATTTTRIPQGPPGGQLRGNAGELGGAGEATSYPAPPGGLSFAGGGAPAGSGASQGPPASSYSDLVAHGQGGLPPPDSQAGGPLSQPPPGEGGGGSGVQGAEPPGQAAAWPYLEPIAKSAQIGAALRWGTLAGEQLGFGVVCPGWATIGECENGHRWAKELVCGQEWCPTCGQDDSVAHRRRMARWWPKAAQLDQMGYLVITLPPGVRWQLEFQRHRKYAYDALMGVVAGKRGHRGRVGGYWGRGLARWHWYGEKAGVWHPHLNILVDGGHLGRRQLRQLRRELARAVRCRDLVVNYQYSRLAAKKAHWLQYVCRATFLNYDWAPETAAALKGFRNARWWGRWDGPAVWGQAQAPALAGADLAAVAALEDGGCPVCGKPIEWRRPRRMAHLVALVKLVPVGAGYYRVLNRGP